MSAYRRDRRKDARLQENGYFVLRFLAEDLGKELDATLDTILRVAANRVRTNFVGRSNLQRAEGEHAKPEPEPDPIRFSASIPRD